MHLKNIAISLAASATLIQAVVIPQETPEVTVTELKKYYDICFKDATNFMISLNITDAVAQKLAGVECRWCFDQAVRECTSSSSTATDVRIDEACFLESMDTYKTSLAIPTTVRPE